MLGNRRIVLKFVALQHQEPVDGVLAHGLQVHLLDLVLDELYHLLVLRFLALVALHLQQRLVLLEDDLGLKMLCLRKFFDLLLLSFVVFQ